MEKGNNSSSNNSSSINPKKIAEGFINKALNRESSLMKTRMLICNKCPLLKMDKLFGKICGKDVYINTDTQETSDKKKPGYKTGCGCVLSAKTRVKDAECPINKW